MTNATQPPMTETGAPAFDPIAAFERHFSTPEHEPFDLDAGAGSPGALLIHGFPGTPAEMRGLGESLYRAGWTARGLLLPGFGRDIRTLAERTLEDWQAAVRGAWAKLHADRQPSILIGHSMGGALAMQMAAEIRPDALILISPFWTVDNALWKTLPALKHVLPTFKPFRLIRVDLDDTNIRRAISENLPGIDWNDPSQREGVRQTLREFAVPLKMLDELRRTGEAAYEAAPRVTSRTLVIQGSSDDLVKPARTQKMVARMQNRPEYHVVLGAHNLPVPNAPPYREVARLVLQFANRVTAQD